MPGREGLIKKAAVARRQLGLEDDVYRALLADRYGVDSSTKLSITNLEDLIAHFCRCGWEPKRRTKSKGLVKGQRKPFYAVPDSDPNWRQKRYIAGMWAALGFDPADLDTRCRRQFGVDKFGWLSNQTSLQTLANDLLGRCQRAGIDPRP